MTEQHCSSDDCVVTEQQDVSCTGYKAVSQHAARAACEEDVAQQAGRGPDDADVQQSLKEAGCVLLEQHLTSVTDDMAEDLQHASLTDADDMQQSGDSARAVCCTHRCGG